MANLLESLAMGLKSAGGTLNPQVYAGNEQEYQNTIQNNRAQENAVRNMVLQAQMKQQMQQQDPEYQAKLQALKNDQLYKEHIGSLGANATEDDYAKAAIKFGKPEIAAQYAKAKEDRALRLQSAQDVLHMRQQQLEQQKALTMQRLTDQRERSAAEMEFKRQSQLIQQQQMGIANQMRLMGMDIQRQGLEIQKQKVDQAGGQQTQKQVQQLGTALEKAGLPEVDSVMANVEGALSTNPKIAEYIAGPKSLLPDLAVSDDIKSGRQAFQKLFNITLKNRSGAAVTSQELDRLKQEFANGAWKTPQQVIDGVNKARKIINDHYASIASSFGKQTLDAYNQNAQEIGARVVVGGGNSTPPPPPGFVEDKK